MQLQLVASACATATAACAGAAGATGHSGGGLSQIDDLFNLKGLHLKQMQFSLQVVEQILVLEIFFQSMIFEHHNASF
jgi:hypothetical protein